MEQYIKHKIRSKNIGTIIGWVLFGTLAAMALALLLGFGVMWLWNWLMPEIFGLTTIGYWQAIGLFALAKIIFGSFGGGSSRKKKEKEKSFSNKNEKECKDFSKWKRYDQFWKEEGENAFNTFINQTPEEEE